MVILTKIIEGQEILEKIEEVTNRHTPRYNVRGENYYLIPPYQTLALKELGANLEFYETFSILVSGIPVVEKLVSNKAKLERKKSLTPMIKEGEKFKYEMFLQKVKEKLPVEYKIK